jgi:hypothetical protein
VFCWRITKYNPRYRDYNETYLKDEWTCYSDIGANFEGKELTFQEYLEKENAYIQAVILFIECLNIASLKVVDLEQGGKRYKALVLAENGLDKIVNNEFVNKESVVVIIRLILRNKMWCKLEAKNMYIHFGYDYYMYIGSSSPSTENITSIEKLGLFVEPCESPYSD